VKKILFAWIGWTDLNAVTDSSASGIGPIAQAIKDRQFDLVILLYNYSQEKVNDYLTWLSKQTKIPIESHYINLSSPTNYAEIYTAAKKQILKITSKYGTKTKLIFHLSPGTSAMTAVWIILSKTQFNAELIESSKDYGVKTANVPFEIAAEFIPDLFKQSDEELQKIAGGFSPESPAFEAIIHRSSRMKKLIEMARRVAVRNVPVLIEGESGTGKELLAQAIHNASPRAKKPFIAVNCGAIPHELVESELFGHKKGAFTGATEERTGHFETANGGTLFLDEIGELPLAAQVKLLRVTQEKKVMKVGLSKSSPVDVRIISATNRNLLEDIQQGRFREDLFYRLAVFLLQLPPLREREGDVGLLIDKFWERLNEENAEELGVEKKELTPAAKNLLLNHHWTGNVRELQNTLLRIMVCCDRKKVTAEDVKVGFFQTVSKRDGAILNHPLGEGFSIEKVIDEVRRHYLERAVKQAKSKSEAARLVGFSNHQTLDNWLKKYNVEN
jgi:transcriptional regulator with PAS, ATPase and Fis domain